MNRTYLLAFSAILIFASTVSTQLDKRIAAIQRIEADVNRLAETAEQDEYSSIFIVELNVNKKENPYPAVGRFATSTKFFYTYGDREKNPYPDRLVKVVAETKRSSNVETVEIYFNETREMVLYSKKVDGDEVSDERLFFTAGRLIRFERQGKTVPLGSRASVDAMNGAIANRARALKIFRAAIVD